MVVTKTDHFVQHATGFAQHEILEERGCDVLIESKSPAKQVRKRKNDPLDGCLSDSIEKFEVDVHMKF